MDHRGFDNLTRAVATRGTRRSFLASVGGAFAAAVGVSLFGERDAAAASCRSYGVTCTSNGQCCSGTCNPKDNRGRRTCSCDADLQTDPGHCGSCGHVCPSTPNGYPVCKAGHCNVGCNEGYVRNPADSTCVPACDTETDPANCGACGYICSGTPNGYPVCNSGRCDVVCDDGYVLNPANSACEPACDTDTDPDNCGSCGHVCSGTANGYPICVSGQCSVGCNDGYVRGPSGSACILPLADKALCTANEQCVGGVCACTSGLCTTSYCMTACSGDMLIATVKSRSGSVDVCIEELANGNNCGVTDCPPALPICGFMGTFCVSIAETN